MIDVSKFQSISVKDESSRTPLICITESSITFGIGAINALGIPPFAKVVFDEENKLLYLFPCLETDLDSFSFAESNKQRYVRLKSINLHRLCNRLSGRSPADYPYRAKGIADSLGDGTPVICFDMSKTYKGGEKTKN